jgi:hypothetical protein
VHEQRGAQHTLATTRPRAEHARMSKVSCLAAAVAGLLAGCSSLHYDLASVPFPVSASPAPPNAAAEPFTATGKTVLWVHGLFGEDQADVAALLREACGSCEGVADFRASSAATFHDWLVTHLTLGFVRMKTTTITGRRIAKAP